MADNDDTNSRNDDYDEAKSLPIPPPISGLNLSFSEIDRDIDLIVPNLYLGSLLAAEDEKCLESLGVTHVLTIAEAPIDLSVRKKFKYMFKQLVDAPWSDLLSILEECIGFIRDGLGTSSNSTVLVHWFVVVNLS